MAQAAIGGTRVKIRHPHQGDWGQLLPLAHAMHEESWFKAFDFSEVKVNAIFHQCLENPDFLGLVAFKDERMIGFFCGVAVEHFFGFDKYACDLVMFVDKAHRGGLTAMRFIRMYEIWCGSRNVREIHLGTSTSVETERTAALYQKLGYHSPALGFRKQCVAGNPET